MRTRIQKWGTSLALRIPKSFAVEAHIDQDSLVELSLVDGKLVVAPIVEPTRTLDTLLAEVNEHNIHYEVDMGPVTGQEVW